MAAQRHQGTKASGRERRRRGDVRQRDPLDEAAADWFWRVIQSGDVRALTYAGARAELGRLGKLEDQTPE